MIGFLFGVGFGGWLFSKLYRSSGGNTKNSLIVAAISGLGAMGLVMLLLGMFLPD